MKNLKDINVGDTITRILAGMPMSLKVGKIDDKYIYTYNHVITLEEGWKFDVNTGYEVDEDLGWDGVTKSGSYIKLD